MLGRDAVHDVARFVEIAHFDQRAASCERLRDDLAPRHVGKLALDARRDRVEKRGVGREQDRLRELVVLGLREEIHRDPVGIARAVATTTRISEGPATMSMPTTPKTRRLAAAT